MPNINEMINGIPQIQRQPRQAPQQPGSGDMSNFLSLQMMVGRELQSTQALHRDLSRLISQLERLIEKNDTPGFTETVASTIEEMATRLENPVINMDFPTDELVAVKRAVESLRFPESKDKVSVTNLSELTRAIAELKPLLIALDKDESEGPEDVVLDKESKKYLKYLENLDTDAKNPLAVRLSDGKEFINQLKSVDSGIRAMTGSSGNNFLTPTSNPTKAFVDGNGILKTTPDAYTVKIAYASAGKPQYIGKAAPGTATSAAAWQISKLTYSTDDVTDVQWAGGSNGFTSIWDNRASLSYS